jgi:hypothetical protein
MNSVGVKKPLYEELQIRLTVGLGAVGMSLDHGHSHLLMCLQFTLNSLSVKFYQLT